MKFHYLTRNNLWETRTRSFFALWPVRLNGQTRWLERVTVKEKVHEGINRINMSSFYYWEKIKFVDDE